MKVYVLLLLIIFLPKNQSEYKWLTWHTTYTKCKHTDFRYEPLKGAITILGDSLLVAVATNYHPLVIDSIQRVEVFYGEEVLISAHRSYVYVQRHRLIWKSQEGELVELYFIAFEKFGVRQAYDSLLRELKSKWQYPQLLHK